MTNPICVLLGGKDDERVPSCGSVIINGTAMQARLLKLTALVCPDTVSAEQHCYAVPGSIFAPKIDSVVDGANNECTDDLYVDVLLFVV